MARNLDPKCKQCRRLGEKLFLKGDRCFSPKCAIVKRNYPPGMHGPKGTQRLSEYGQQLKEKQKALKVYRLMERQLHGYYLKAKQMKGDTGESFMRLLESRLDNVVYRLGLLSSRDAARQAVSHGAIIVDGKKVDIPSYQVKVGQSVSIKPEQLEREGFKEVIKKINAKDLPAWLAFTDDKKLQAQIVGVPQGEELKQNIDAAMVVEYYSR